MSDSPADNNDDDTEAQYHDTIEDDGLIRTDCSVATSQGYQEIAAAEDSASPSRIPFYNRPWIPDTSWHVLGHELVDGVVVVKFLKLLVLTAVGILLTFVFVRVLDFEYDGKLHVWQIAVYEWDLICRDAAVFFVVGRLYQQRGVDHLAWILWMLAASVYSSYITAFKFLQHSFTLYEMHCTWPPVLWIFVAFVAVLVVGVLWMHVQYAVRTGIFVRKVLELVLAFGVFLGPLLSSPYFHLHHWYAGWLIGMHANYDVWWSRAVMAWCWGCYINGIGVYGRDPVLTCDFALHMGESQSCPFLKCYEEGIHHPHNHSHHVDPMVPPDWRNCSASTYHTRF